MSNFVSPHTKPFQDFKKSFDQSVLLTQLIGRAGLDAISEQREDADSLIRDVTGLNLDAFAELNEEARRKVSGSAQPDDVERMEEVYETVQPLLHLATHTTPHVILVFLMAIFEAYLQDIVLMIVEAEPSLLPRKPGEPIRKTIDREFFFHKGMSDVNTKFNLRLKIPFDLACNKANTSPSELDQAKVLRNIHLHNGGRINQDFIKRFGDSGLVLDDYYPITMDYVTDIKDKVFLTAMGVDLLALTHYPQLPFERIRLA